jgi:hypothetical protein
MERLEWNDGYKAEARDIDGRDRTEETLLSLKINVDLETILINASPLPAAGN